MAVPGKKASQKSGLALESYQFRNTLKDIDKLTKKCSQITSDLKQRVAKSTTSLKNALAEIDNFRKEINKRLDELEKEIKDTATTIQHDNNKKLKTTETTCDDINKSLQASADTLKNLNSNKKTDQLFTELKRLRQLIPDKSNVISQLPTINDIDEYIFEPNQAIKKVLQDQKSLGTLSSKKLKQPAEPNNQGAVAMKFSIPIKINAKSSTDEKNCWITGIAVSPQNQLFAVDINNLSIKMININSGTIKQIKLITFPWDITIVSTDTLAVTLPENKTIQFISFSPHSLSLKNKLNVDGKCYGISHHQGKLAVTFLSPVKLRIMDLKGNTAITVDNSGNRFSYPQYVTTNSHSIYVSDFVKEVVLRFNWQGKMKGLVGIKYSKGISQLDDGSLLVNGYGSDCICTVSGDCKETKTILEDVDGPWAVCWCADNSALCVSRFKDDSDDNYIKVYKMM